MTTIYLISDDVDEGLRQVHENWQGHPGNYERCPHCAAIRTALAPSRERSWCVECGESWPCASTVERRKDGIPHRAAGRDALRDRESEEGA